MKKLLNFDELLLHQPYSFKNDNLPQVPLKHFMLSFTDSFIFLLKQQKINKDDTLLLPDFYCPETTNEMSKYMKVVFYHINADLSVDKNSYFSRLKKYKPSLVVNYCFTGFSLTLREKKLLKELCDNSLVIEDCAHRILQAKDISYITKNHYFIDSIRKYSPFLGSHIISQSFKTSLKPKILSVYKIKIIFFQLLIQIFGHIAIPLHLVFLDKLGEYIFNIQDAIVGTSLIPMRGDIISYFLWGKLNLDKIKEHNNKISSVYFEILHKKNLPYIKKIQLKSNYLKELIYYPLVVDSEVVGDLIKFLSKKNIFISTLWDASLLRESQVYNMLYSSLIVLPLSSLINTQDAIFIANSIKEFLLQRHISNKK